MVMVSVGFTDTVFDTPAPAVVLPVRGNRYAADACLENGGPPPAEDPGRPLPAAAATTTNTKTRSDDRVSQSHRPGEHPPW
jgi:hypothetical protein